MNIDKSFKAYMRDDLKVWYKLKLQGETKNVDRRDTLKILWLDEKNLDWLCKIKTCSNLEKI